MEPGDTGWKGAFFLVLLQGRELANELTVYLKIISIVGSGACDAISLDNLFYKQGANYNMVVCEEYTERFMLLKFFL